MDTTFNNRQFRKMNTITHTKSMPDRLEAKYFEFTVQILQKKISLRVIFGPQLVSFLHPNL